MDTNELKALAKMMAYAADTLSAMLEGDAEPMAAMVKPEMPTVDWSKPVQTRDGRRACVISVNTHDVTVRVDLCNLVGGVTYRYYMNGKSAFENCLDIINVPEPPPLDLTKPVQTRDGRRVRILCTDRRNGTYPVVGLVMSNNSDSDEIRSWSINGRYYNDTVGDSETDLINVPTEQF